MRSLACAAALAIMLSAVSACRDADAGPLRELWKEQFGAVSAEERVLEATTESLEQLAQLHGPDLAARVGADFLTAELEKHLDSNISEVSGVRAELSDQAIVVGADFSYAIPTLAIPVRGRVVGLVAMSFDGNDLVLRPALDAIHISSVGPLTTDLGVLDDLVNGLFEQSSRLFLDTLNARLTKLAPYRLRFDPDARLPVPTAESQAEISAVTANLMNPVLLVDESGITVLADVRLDGDSEPPALTPPASEQGLTGWPQLQGSFNSRLARVAPAGVPDQPLWIAFRPDFVRDRLATLWPPVSLADEQWKAIRGTEAELARLPPPDAAFFVSSETIRAVVADAIARRDGSVELDDGASVGLDDTVLDFDRQSISLETGFTLTSIEPKALVTGTLTGGVAVRLVDNEVRLRPAFQSVRLAKIDQSILSVDFGAAVPALNGLLDQLLTTINSVVTAKPMPAIPLTFQPLPPVDLASKLRYTPGVSDVVGNPIPIDLQIGGASMLIDVSGIYGIVVLRKVDNDASAKLAASSEIVATSDDKRIDEAFEALRTSFTKERDKLAPSPGVDAAAWVAIDKAFLAGLLNERLGKLGLCASYALPKIEQPIPRTKLEIFKSGAISCPAKTDDRECGQASCKRKKDTRNCRRCISYDLGFIKDEKCVNDTTCELAKAAQNVIYDGHYAACETERKLKKDACELAKGSQNALYASEKLACEGYKELVKQVGDWASVDGKVALAGKPRACLSAVAFEKDLSKAQLKGGLDIGTIKVSGELHYVPHNIPGNFGCPGEWRKPFHASVSVDPLKFDANKIAIKPQAGAAGLDLLLTLPARTITAEMKPRPIEAIFGNNPDLVVRCPGPAAVGVGATLLNEAIFTASGKDLVPELRGQLSFGTEEQTFALTIPSRVETVADNLTLRFEPVWNPKGNSIGLVAHR